MLVEKPASGLLKAVPQNNVLLELGPAKIEVAVAKTEILRGKLFTFAARDWNRRHVRFRQSRELDCLQLDVAGGHFRISHVFGPGCDLSRYRDNVFLPEGGSLLDYRSARPVRIEGNLEKSRAVTQIDENEPTKVPDAMHPSGDCHLPS
jgi:hypothetical protein